MKFEVLAKQHITQLMAFEYENRDWFELFIESRGDDFYNQKSTEQHLLDLTQQYLLGKNYPAVVIINNQIVGRVNLKNICLKSKTAEVGYRVAKTYAGSGVASFGLKQLIKISKEELGLNYLKGLVLENNPASARVLEKQGFVQVKKIDHFYHFSGKDLSCVEYQLQISQPANVADSLFKDS